MIFGERRFARAVGLMVVMTVIVVTAGMLYWWRTNQPWDGVNILNVYSGNYNGPNCQFFDMNGKKLSELNMTLCSFSDHHMASATGSAASAHNQLSLYDQNLNELWHNTRYNIHHDIIISEKRREVFVPITAHRYFADGETVTLKELMSDEDVTEVAEVRGFDFEGHEIFAWDPFDHKDELVKNFISDGKWFPRLSKVNSIALIEEPLSPDDKTIFIPGNLILSMNNGSGLAVLDRASKKLIWFFKPDREYYHGIHSVQITSDHKLLAFVNHEEHEGPYFSEVIKVDPYSKQIIWRYRAEKNGEFYTKWGGHVMELPNRHLLINADKRIFEMTLDKKIVWSMDTPLIDNDGKPAYIYRVRRMSHELYHQFFP